MAPFTSTPTQFFISSSLTIQNHLILLFTVIIVTFSDGTTAQDHPSPAPPPYFTSRFNPTMAIIIVILITAFFFLGFFSIYLRQCGNNTGRSNWGRAVTAARSRRVGSRGLDPELIEKFPTLVYSDVKVHKIGKGALECAVCLSEFEDNQMLRLLPICDHVFHPECIDQWLGSHTTCPVCRTNLAVVVDSSDSNVEQERDVTPAEVVVEEGSGGDSRSPGRRDEVEQVDCTEAPPPVLDLRRGGSLRAAARSILAWGSKSARPAVGAQTGAGQIWSEEERERFTLRLPDYVRQEVLAGKLSRSVSVTVFPTEESLRRGCRGGGGGMDGEGSSLRGGRSWKLRGGGPARSDRWAFLTSFNWRSVGGGGGGDGEGSIKREGPIKREASIKREGPIKREGSTRRGGDGGGLEGSTKGKLFGPLDCLGGGGNSSGKDAGDEESQIVAFAKV